MEEDGPNPEEIEMYVEFRLDGVNNTEETEKIRVEINPRIKENHETIVFNSHAPCNDKFIVVEVSSLTGQCLSLCFCLKQRIGPFFMPDTFVLFQGSDFLKGLSPSDFSMLIGQEQCSIVDVTNNVITCMPTTLNGGVNVAKVGTHTGRSLGPVLSIVLRKYYHHTKSRSPFQHNVILLSGPLWFGMHKWDSFCGRARSL